MRIVHLCLACFYIEGMEYQENVLPRKHKQLGHVVSIITSQYTFDTEGNQGERALGSYLNSDGINVTVLPYADSKYAKNYRLYKGLYENLSLQKPDIIFCHGPQFFGIYDLIKYKKSNPSVKIFVDNHGDYVNSKIDSYKRKLIHRYIWGYCARKIEKYAEIIWGVTPLRVKYLQDIYKIKPQKTGLLIMGGDEEKIHFENQEEIKRDLRQKWSIPYRSFLITTGGKIDEHKNIHLLMEAVNRLNYPNVHLAVFGTANVDMKLKIEKFAQNERIHLVGWIPSEQAYNWFLASDLIVFPGTHSVLWEQAVACGIPCVFKHWEGMDHVDVGGNCKFLYQDSIDEIEKVLKTIVGSKEIYQKMKVLAVEKGIKEFSYLEIAKRSIN